MEVVFLLVCKHSSHICLCSQIIYTLAILQFGLNFLIGYQSEHWRETAGNRRFICILAEHHFLSRRLISPSYSQSVIFVLCIVTFNYMCFKYFSHWCRDFFYLYRVKFSAFIFSYFKVNIISLLLFLILLSFKFSFKIFNSNWNYCKASDLKFTFIPQNW